MDSSVPASRAAATSTVLASSSSGSASASASAMALNALSFAARVSVTNSTEAARADGKQLPALDPGVVVLDQLRVAMLRADLYGELLRWQLEVDEEAGLIGRTFAAGRDGQRVETGEQVRGLARLEAEWRDRVVRFAKTAHDMGIADAQIELQQAQAELVVSAFLAALAAIPGLLPVARQEALTAFLAGLGRGGETVAGAVVAGAGEPA